MTPAVRRRRQRGQVIPLAAIMATVLIGGVALATDLSLQTHYHRNLQNATDAASVLLTPYQPPAGTTDNPDDGYFSVYAPPSSAAGLYVEKNSTQLVMTGTVYMPSGMCSVGQNVVFSTQGQVIVDSWEVQSGNHANPVITYDTTRVASERETRLIVQ